MQSKKIRLKDVAEHLNVSVTTVARALNRSPLTSKEMTERVEAAAAKLGYVRSLDGVRLRTGKSFVVAALLKFPANSDVGDPTLPDLLQGLHSRCSGSDYSVTAIVSTSLEQDISELKKLIHLKSADAVVLDYTSPQDPRVKLLLEADFPFVTYGQTELFSPHAFIDIDNEHAAWQGANALISAGYKNIALLDGEDHLTYVKQRVLGYKRALKEANIAFDADLVSNFEPDAQTARKRAEDLCRQGKADAMLCVNEMVLIGAQAGVRDYDRALLEKIGFAVRGGSHLAQYLDQSPFISYYSRLDTGWHLGDLALRLIQGEDIDDLQRLEQTQLKQ